MPDNRRRDAGFSLVELLVVMILMGIVLAIAVPRFQRATRRANEASAIASMRVISGAETAHASLHSTYGTLAALRAANLIDDRLANGTKSSFDFQITLIAAATGAQSDYVSSAVPSWTLAIIGTGTRRLGSSAEGVIYNDYATIDTHYTTKAELSAGTSAAIKE